MEIWGDCHMLADTIIMMMTDENNNVHKINASLERIRAIRVCFHPSTMLPAAIASRAYNVHTHTHYTTLHTHTHTYKHCVSLV